MIDKTIFHKDRLDFNGNNKIQKRNLSSTILLDIIIMSIAYNKEMTTNESIIIIVGLIFALMIFILLLIRDYSNDTLIKEIDKITLSVNLIGDFRVKIKNKKRRIRVINLGKNHMEVSKYLDFAKKNHLQIDYNEKVLAHIVD